MTTFIDFLEELKQSRQAVVLPSDQVEQLVARFGPVVRSMGFYDKNGDGSVEIPMNHVTEAVQALGDRNLAAAVSQLRSSEEPAGVHEQDSARRLIETLAGLYLRQFKNRWKGFRTSATPLKRIDCGARSHVIYLAPECREFSGAACLPGSRSTFGSGFEPVASAPRILSWINSEPGLPSGTWCKDFGSFKLVGEGAVPKTFLTRDQPCYGVRLR